MLYFRDTGLNTRHRRYDKISQHTKETNTTTLYAKTNQLYHSIKLYDNTVGLKTYLFAAW